jgi:hypothetical protein
MARLANLSQFYQPAYPLRPIQRRRLIVPSTSAPPVEGLLRIPTNTRKLFRTKTPTFLTNTQKQTIITQTTPNNSTNLYAKS